jgi:hypothetical protein
MVGIIRTSWGWSFIAVIFLAIAEAPPRRFVSRRFGVLAVVGSSMALLALVIFTIMSVTSWRFPPSPISKVSWLLMTSLVATWAYYEQLARAAGAMGARGLRIALRLVAYGAAAANGAMLLLVRDELPRFGAFIFAAVAPPPGVGFASTVYVVLWNIVRFGRFEKSLLLWAPVPLFVIPSIGVLIFTHRSCAGAGACRLMSQSD